MNACYEIRKTGNVSTGAIRTRTFQNSPTRITPPASFLARSNLASRRLGFGASNSEPYTRPAQPDRSGAPGAVEKSTVRWGPPAPLSAPHQRCLTSPLRMGQVLRQCVGTAGSFLSPRPMSRFGDRRGVRWRRRRLKTSRRHLSRPRRQLPARPLLDCGTLRPGRVQRERAGPPFLPGGRALHRRAATSSSAAQIWPSEIDATVDCLAANGDLNTGPRVQPRAGHGEAR